jgi:hypothetical protein
MVAEAVDEPTFTMKQESDGRWLAVQDEPSDSEGESAEVHGWDDIVRLRSDWERVDLWPEGRLQEFVLEFGESPDVYY